MNNFEKMMNDAFGANGGRNGDRPSPNLVDMFGSLAEELVKNAPKGEPGQGGFPFPFPFGRGENPFTTPQKPYEEPRDAGVPLTEDEEACSCNDCMCSDELSPEGYNGECTCGTENEALVDALVSEDYSEDKVTYAIDLPGVKADDIEVELLEGHAIIKAERYDVFEPNELEFVYNTVLHLDAKTDFDKVETEYENGVLVVTAPFREDLKPRTVKVKVKGDSGVSNNDTNASPTPPAKKTAAKKTAPAKENE